MAGTEIRSSSSCAGVTRVARRPISRGPNVFGEITVANHDHWVAYNPTDYLNTPADIVDYLDAALEDGDDRVLVLAIGDAAQAIGGMAELSRRTGLSEEALAVALSPDTSPSLSTIRTILKAFGLGLAGRPLEAA
ncbi:MAG: putative addiction module antidote protein [Alphaproteobacteria bacterium]|nr:putative addiction module antidote protein [Alphaproteobacteria bacterium]